MSYLTLIRTKLLEVLKDLIEFRTKFDQTSVATTARLVAIEKQIAALDAKNDQVLVELAKVGATLEAIINILSVLPAERILFAIRFEDGKILEGVTNLILTDVQKVTASITPVDAKGNPAAVDGVPSWTSSNPRVS